MTNEDIAAVVLVYRKFDSNAFSDLSFFQKISSFQPANSYIRFY